MMNNSKISWSERVKARLLAISTLQDDFDTALSEWVHAGGFKDHGCPTATCDLCGHTKLRYHYLVANRETGEALWVGSQCIINFDVEVRDRLGRVVVRAGARQRVLDDHAEDVGIDQMLRPLVELYDHLAPDKRRNLHWMTGRALERNGFAPLELVRIFQRLTEKRIAFEVECFRVCLRAKKDRQDLRGLSQLELDLIWPCLSAAQCKRYFGGEKGQAGT